MSVSQRSTGETSVPRAAASPWWNRAWFAPTLVLVTGLLAYANSFQGVFVFDEFHFLVENPSLKTLRFWTYDLGGSRPIGFLSFALNYAVGGFDPWGYHAVNLAIHLAVAWLLYLLVRDTLTAPRLPERFGAKAPWLALACALIFLVHPLETQSVTYIYQRLESLMALFYLLTLYAFVRAQRSHRPAAWYVASVIACAAGAGVKEVIVTAPLLVLWYDRVFVADCWRELVRRRGMYYAALAATWGLLAGQMLHHPSDYSLGSGLLVVKNISPLDYALNQPAIILHYLRLAVWPRGLCLEYSWLFEQDPVALAPPILALVVIVVLTVWLMWRRPALGFLAGTFFLILGPTSSIVPIKDLCYEHRMYMPLACLIVLTVLAIDGACHRLFPVTLGAAGTAARFKSRAIAISLLASVVVALTVGTIVRNRAYHSTLAFWEDNVAKRPDNPSARQNFAKFLNEANRPSEALDQLNLVLELTPQNGKVWLDRGATWLKLGYPEKCLADYQRAAELGHQPPLLFVNRGAYFEQIGDHAAALADFNHALELDPKNAAACFNRGCTNRALGDRDRALADFSHAIELRADFGEALVNRGLMLVQLGRFDAAIADFDRAIELAYDLPQTYNHRGAGYEQWGKFPLAIADYDRAIELDPKLAAAFYNRGKALRLLGQRQRAVADFTRALQLRPDDALAYTNRGACHLELNDLPQALADENRAIELKPDLTDAYNNRAVYYFVQKQYDLAWADVHKLRELGGKPNPAFLRDLSSASGRGD